MSQNWNLINKQTGQQDPELRQAHRESRGGKGLVAFAMFSGGLYTVDSVNRQNLSGQNLSGLKPIGTKPIAIIPIRTKPTGTYPISEQNLSGYNLSADKTYRDKTYRRTKPIGGQNLSAGKT
jgi:hypothetical protein